MGVKLNPFTGKLDVVDSPSGDFSTVELNRGTEESPSIAFDSDSDTGIYSPGADQLAISTGGTGRLFVDDSGNVEFRSSIATFNSTSDTYIAFQSGTGTPAPTRQARIQAISTGGGGNGHSLAFLTNQTGGAPTERLRIDSSGTLIHVGGGGSYTTPAVQFNGSAPANSFVIDSSGNVGIGTVSPADKMEIIAGTNAGLQIGAASGTGNIGLQIAGVMDAIPSARVRGYIGTTNSSGGVAGDLLIAPRTNTVASIRFITRGSGSPSEAMRVHHDGNVGIGTTSPGSPLTTYTNSPNTDNTGAVCELRNLDSAPVAGTDNVNMLRLVTNTSNGYTAALIGVGKYENSSSGRGEVKIKVAQTALSSSLAEFSFRGDGQFTAPGNVGIGTTPAVRFHVNETITTGTDVAIQRITTASGGSFNVRCSDLASAAPDWELFTGTSEDIVFSPASSEKARIDASGRLLVGTVSSSTNDSITAQGNSGNSTGNANLRLRRGETAPTVDNTVGFIGFENSAGGTGASITAFTDANWTAGSSYPSRLVFSTAASGASSPDPRMTIDSSGRLLVGTTSVRAVGSSFNPQILLETPSSAIAGFAVISNRGDAFGPSISLGKSRAGSVGGTTVVAQDDILGEIRFAGADGTDVQTQGALIQARVDGTPGSNTMPGRLVFSTTSTTPGASPTERMRINENGDVAIMKTGAVSVSTYGSYFRSDDATHHHLVVTHTDATASNSILYLNRQNSDGQLIQFRQGNNEEGNITVSGTTVSLNGGHLARWSQLPGNATPIEILRGSVLSNIDEMCEWAYEAEAEVLWTEDDELPEGVNVGDVKTPAKPAGTEDNEQLNRMKVSDVEGDRNVAGVFDTWDDDPVYTNDFYCAMTGDFIIRIGADVTVERGDLLMSAGDGTAKPQDDDIIRSKTIAKVTSTNVSCTYDDGSYCVPCVLMAC